MSKYTIQLNYLASYTCDVYADNEGEALDKARDMAEDADIKQFNIFGERNAEILRTE